MNKEPASTEPEARIVAIILAILPTSLAIAVGELSLTGQMPSDSFPLNSI